MRFNNNKLTEKHKNSVHKENITFYQGQINTIYKTIEPLEKRVKEIKENINVNELKIKGVLLYLVKRPDLALAKDLL